jgi:Leucine-rich repeat (LRR) protein
MPHTRFPVIPPSWVCLVALLCAVPRPAAAADDKAIVARLESLGAKVELASDDTGRVTGVVIANGARVTPADVAACGRLAGLRTLQVSDCRGLDDETVRALVGLQHLETLDIVNSAITDAAVETIATAFPGLVDLDLSSNANVTGQALKWISRLEKLQRLGLMQNRFNDINTRRLVKLQALQSVDLRGNMEAGDLTLGVLGTLPHLRALKHRSTTVTDDGIERLAASPSLVSLLAQDFAITSAAGPALGRIRTLESLEIFRCQGFGSAGVTALAPLKKLVRLTLRDLPDVDDAGLAVLADLPAIERLYLHELGSVGDAGLAHLAAAKRLEVLDVWRLPKMTDATVALIAALPNLQELSIRETGVSAACLDRIAEMPRLHSLTFQDNGPIPEAVRAKLAGRKWKKLDLGPAR